MTGFIFLALVFLVSSPAWFLIPYPFLFAVCVVIFWESKASLSPEMTVLLSVVYRICSVFSQCLFEWKYYADLVDNSVSLKLKMG